MSLTNHVKTIEIEIAGIGIIMYSPSFGRLIHENEDFLSKNYFEGADVQRYIQSGTIVGFGTASPGTFLLSVYAGVPDDETLARSEFKLRLAIAVVDLKVVVRDMYDLMSWKYSYDDRHCIPLDENGIYRLTLASSRPASGIIGDRQKISCYLEKWNGMPALARQGVPMLCN